MHQVLSFASARASRSYAPVRPSQLHQMNISFIALLPFLAVGIHTCCAAEKDKKDGAVQAAPPAAKQQSVRMRFVPESPPRKGSADYEGASQTDLGPGPVKGVLWCQAHAGVGDQFPVIDKQGITLFEVRLVEGNDDHVVLEISSNEGVKKIDLPRDKRGAIKVGGIEYELLYPSVPWQAPRTKNLRRTRRCSW